MHPAKRWMITPPAEAARELADCLKTSRLIAQMLINRGLSEAADCQAFLSPSLKQLHEPSLLAGLPQAAERIVKAIRDGQKIVIYGDYDVDGITATSILWHAIRLLGGQVDYYIPHRIEEGYGLNADALKEIIDQGAGLIVSVDCGITAIAEAQGVRDRGVDLIITDHHEWRVEESDRRSAVSGQQGAILPVAYAIVHPRLGSYPNPYLCGAGVAFKLAW